MSVKLHRAGDTKAHALISSGAVDRSSPWSFSPSDGNELLGPKGDDWARYGAVHLGEDPDADAQTRERFKYPFAKLKGDKLTLYRSALVAIRDRAGQQGASAIEEAAGALLAEVDRKKEARSMAKKKSTATPDRPLLLGLSRTEDSTTPRTVSLEATATIDFEAAEPEDGNNDGGDSPQLKLPRFTMVANNGNPMKLAGWRYPVVLDLDGLDIPSQARPIRMNHSAEMGVGHTRAIGVQDGRLVASGVISRDTPHAREVIASARNGFPWQASVGASVDNTEFVPEKQSTTVNGKTFEGPLVVARKSRLGEISFVDLGADDQTSSRVAAAADADTDDRRDFERPADGKEGTMQAIRRAQAERERQSGIQALVTEALTERGVDVEAIEALAEQALDEKWAVKDFQIALLRASRPKPPGAARQSSIPQPKVLEAALCMSFGLSDQALAKDRDYGDAVVTAAYPHRNLGIRGVVCEALQAAGIRVPWNHRELYDTLMQQQRIQAAGFSTINLPGILGNVANKVLLNAFVAVNATYDRIAEQADFANFQTHTMFRLDHLGEFARVGNDGQLHSGSLSQTSFTNKVDTYGQLLTFTRQDIINDDLNAFRTLTQQLARRARIAVENSLYSVVCEASDVFYTTGQGNKLTGSLAIDTLGSAEAALLGMADAGGFPIYASPRYILVPPALKWLADSIYTSAEIRAYGSTSSKPVSNPFVGRFEVVSSPFLQSAVITGNSATTWYLLADPVMLPAFQVAYLDGRRAPTIETSESVFNMLGFQMRCYFDYGVSQLDYRGAIKNV